MGALFDTSIVRFETIPLDEANRHLSTWGHKMGPVHRPMEVTLCHGLFHKDELMALTTTSRMIPAVLSQELSALTRENCCELSRLCASRPGLCRVALRIWREFVFPGLDYSAAISYQDADLHSGNTYRFDGWKRVGYSASGTDARSGKKGRKKWIWLWQGEQKANQRG